MASVKVAVRVRPLNNRELDMDAAPIIEMDGKKTRISNLKIKGGDMEGDIAREKYKDFTFDYSYWSYNSKDSHFATQEQVFKDLGNDVVQNAFEGYNACLFAYGQTGSGKTHTMMGIPSDLEGQGLIPRICRAMFNRMNEGKVKGTTYRTEVSYLEIYNERVKDLLKNDQSHNLRVREHPKQGPYVEELSKHLVLDYTDIEKLMKLGNANRTTACTNMNDTSSRSHAIFTMQFVQASFIGDLPSETVSKIHLVDLAGSERADSSGATGQRLKEGGHINKSLVTLGSVISSLAELSNSIRQNKSKQVFIPYRDSVLTWLLKDSLGGNSKTIMIATISPADCNYGETLSTLRYANRAKNIINKPTINEDSNVKLIKELREEINKLRSLLGSNKNNSDVIEELHKKEAKEAKLTEEWTDKWKESTAILLEQKDLALRKAGTGVVLDSQMPHLIGIDDDLFSTGITLYHLREGRTHIGTDSKDKDKHDIILKGVGLENEHCSIELENGVATLIPNAGASCMVNGQPVNKPTFLSTGCVILLGRTNMFRYNDPAEAEKLRREGSRSNVNLSRLSFMSRSNTELVWASEGEENNILEEKRKQLELEELRLQKESQELLAQKILLEEQINSYQKEKEEAWKAEEQKIISTAASNESQKELEFEENDFSLHKIINELSTADLKRLVTQINEQKTVVLECLESNDSDKEELNHQMSILQDLRTRYLEIERILGRNTKSRWLDYDDSFDYDRGADDDTLGGDSELDDSEIQSSIITEITENDDQIQMLVEQRVERRLRDILNQMHSGKPLTHILRKKLTQRNYRRSLPNGLDNNYTSGSDDELSSSSPQHLPRSVSLNSGLWPATFNNQESLIPGILDITIPKYIVRGKGNLTHYQYEIQIVTPIERWIILRRYRRFRDLQQAMKKKYGLKVNTLLFPSRKIFGSRSERVAIERRPQLEEFLHSLIKVCSTIPNCPLYNCGPSEIKSCLINFSNFFEKGIFENTIYGTS